MSEPNRDKRSGLQVAVQRRYLQHTRGTADVVESKIRDTLVELEKERERLSDTAGSTKDGDLGVLKTNYTLAAVRRMVRRPAIPNPLRGFGIHRERQLAE